MHDFTYLRPQSVEEAVALNAKFVSNSTFIAGGTNLLYLMKRGVRTPEYLINLKSIEGLNSIEFEREKGLRVGGLVNISKLQHSEYAIRNYPMLSSCAGRIATPQIRNVATVGGNLSQEVWCWYLAEGFDCWMNGGKHCYAPAGDNRYHHSVAGGYICLAVHPSDLATALYALDSRVIVAGIGEQRELRIDELLPGFTKVHGKLKQNILKNSEIITEVKVPLPKPGSRSIYLKYAARESFDFSLCSVAIVMDVKGNYCEDARVVLGGIATKPYRSTKVETMLKGKSLTRNLIEKASGDPFDREIPLSMNAYRIQFTKELIRRALFELSMPNEVIRRELI